MFSCQDIEAFIESIVDGEFDGQEHVEVNDHIAQCTPCRQLVQGRLNLKKLFVSSLSVSAPPELKERIFASLDAVTPLAEERELDAEHSSTRVVEDEVDGELAEIAEKDGSDVASNDVEVANDAPPLEMEETPAVRHYDGGASRSLMLGHRGDREHFGKVALLLLAAAALLFVAIIPQWTVAPATTEGLSVWEESVDWHRSDVPMEVSGPNVDGVAQWFHGKVNFDVDPLSFGQNSNAQLVGGRLASVHNRRAALLNYLVNGAHVTVLVFDGKGISVPSDRLQTFDNQQIAVMEGPGYDIALFHKNDLTYTITTDLPSSKFDHLIHQVLSSN